MHSPLALLKTFSRKSRRKQLNSREVMIANTAITLIIIIIIIVTIGKSRSHIYESAEFSHAPLSLSLSVCVCVITLAYASPRTQSFHRLPRHCQHHTISSTAIITEHSSPHSLARAGSRRAQWRRRVHRSGNAIISLSFTSACTTRQQGEESG